MCDDLSPAELKAAGQQQAGIGIDRRQFAALATGAALAGCAGGGYASSTADGGLAERRVEIATPDGMADGFFVHPAKGRHPGVILWPDIAGLREVFRIMARRLASAGYAVLVVNSYYRGGPAPFFNSFADFRTPEGQARVAPLRAALTPAAITSDAAAFVAFLDGSKAVDKGRKIGSQGYCIGGPFAVRTAAAAPTRVGAAVSLHGAGLVTEAADSPHRLIAGSKAAFHLAVARNDDARDPASTAALRKVAEGRPVTVEVYPADHGWCVADGPSWNPDEAERAWQAMMKLYAAL